MSDITELCAKATQRPWRRVAMGGSSTVLSSAQPKRNDTRIPAYAYREEHCIAYPLIEEDGHCRWDFVCFSHADAELVTYAVNNIEHLTTQRDAAIEALGELVASIEKRWAAETFAKRANAVSPRTEEAIDAAKTILAALSEKETL